MNTEPSIYVACLASYNHGYLHGDWIVPSSNKDDMFDQIKEILKNSPIEDAEEFAIHDYDDFPNLGEYPSLEKVADVQCAIEEHGADIVSAFLKHFNFEDLDKIEYKYLGHYDSFEQFAEDLADETFLIDCPENIRYYFDYEKFSKDLEHDYYVSHVSDGVHIFESY